MTPTPTRTRRTVAGLVAGALAVGGASVAEAKRAPTRAPAPPEAAQTLRGTVVRVVDGTLLHVRIGKRSQAVRLLGVGAAGTAAGGRSSCLGRQARDVLERLAPVGRTVRIVGDPGRRITDARGAVSAYVYPARGPAGTASVNRALIASGLGTYTPPRAGSLRFGRSLDRAENRARRATNGRWGQACTLSTAAGVQRRLVELGYLPKGSVTGGSNYRTEQAVMAFQGWSGLARDGVVGPATRRALARAARPTPSRAVKGRHLEVHVGRQVLLAVDNGRVVRAVHVSTGRSGNTPRGRFSVIRRERMSWSRPFSTWMPYAQYFIGGFAIHESKNVPGYPASAGCVRMPAPEAPVIWDFAGYGTPLIVV